MNIAAECGDRALELTMIAGLAALEHHLRRPDEALRVAQTGLERARQARNTHVVVWMLDLIAAFTAEASPVEAVVLAAAAEAVREKAGGGVLPEFLWIDDAQSVARRHLSSGELDEAWKRGRLMDLDEAIEMAKMQHADRGEEGSR